MTNLECGGNPDLSGATPLWIGPIIQSAVAAQTSRDSAGALQIARDQSRQWLRHSDARQVSDLPTHDPLIPTVYDRAGRRPDEREWHSPGKSQTCRASEWPSHYDSRIAHRQKPPPSQVCRDTAKRIWSAVATPIYRERHRFGSTQSSKAPSPSRQVGTLPAHCKLFLPAVAPIRRVVTYLALVTRLCLCGCDGIRCDREKRSAQSVGGECFSKEVTSGDNALGSEDRKVVRGFGIHLPPHVDLYKSMFRSSSCDLNRLPLSTRLKLIRKHA
jgi:hypothetical protein